MIQMALYSLSEKPNIKAAFKITNGTAMESKKTKPKEQLILGLSKETRRMDMDK